MTPKVGLLTFHYTTNYGGVLQAYAVIQLLEKLNVEASTIDYRPIRALRVYAKALFLNKNFLHGFLKYIKFSRFIYLNLKLSPCRSYHRKKLIRICNAYDALIVGSDEVWKTSSFRGFDPSFFLNFSSQSQKKISFSASVGGEENFAGNCKAVSQLLSGFDAISVRDDQTAKSVLTCSGVLPVRTLDPTLLIDFPSFKSSVLPDKDYVLVYGSFRYEEMDAISRLANEMSCSVISVGFKNPLVDKNFISAGLEDWVELIRSARRVITSFFHGAIFSLKFHDEVFIVDKPCKSYKITQLVKDLALVETEMLLANQIILKHLRNSVETEDLIAKGRGQAIDYLKGALLDSVVS